MNSKLVFSAIFVALIMTGSAIAEGWKPAQDDTDEDATASSLSSLQAQMSQLAASNSAVSSAYAAQAAAVQAQIALIQAEASLQANKMGMVGNTSLSNEVSAGTISSDAEASLMASFAIQQGGRKVADKIAADCRNAHGTCDNIYILETDLSDYRAAALTYHALLGKADAAMATAEKAYTTAKSCAVPPPSKGQSHNMMVAADVVAGTVQKNSVGLILDTLEDFGSHFANSYAYNALSATAVDADFQNAVAGELVSRGENVYFTSAVYDTGASTFDAEFKLYEDRYLTLVSDEVTCKAAITKLDAKDPLVVIYTNVITDIDSGKTEFNALLPWLTGTTDKAPEPPLVKVVAWEYLGPRINNTNASILTLAGKPVAAVYTKKGLWSFFGGPQLYASGGASINYRLTSAVDGRLIGAGIVPVDSGYRSINQVQKLFGPSPTSRR